MKTRIIFLILVAGIGLLLAHAPPAQPHRMGPAEIYPDSVMTPGAANPQVTQANIGDTICSRRWSTKLIRPPAGYTSKLKRRQLREYGDHRPSGKGAARQPKHGEGRDHPLRCPFRQHGLL
jgi:hypothetical protein